jgi:hypothetical protein
MVIALAACASGANPSSGPPRIAGEAQSGGGMTLGALQEAAIPKGECGMILWTLESQRPTAIFRMTVGRGGDLVVNGKKVSLALSEIGGASAVGVFEDTSLAGEGLVVSVKARFGLGFDGGAYLEQGLLTVEDADGWRTVVPAAGVAGCRAK